MYRALCNISIRIGSVPLVRLLGSFLIGEKTEGSKRDKAWVNVRIKVSVMKKRGKKPENALSFYLNP